MVAEAEARQQMDGHSVFDWQWASLWVVEVRVAGIDRRSQAEVVVAVAETQGRGEDRAPPGIPRRILILVVADRMCY